MKRVYTLLACILLLPKLVWAQHYIELNKENTFHYKNSYLIDIPTSIEPFHTNLFVQDPHKLVPIRAYHTISNIRDESESLKFRFIDTVFVSHNKQIGEIGLQLTTLRKNITEYIVTEDDNIDTLVDMDNRFKLYKQLQKQDKKDSVLIYYSESGGGDPCCYPDSVYQKAEKYSLESFIHSFEKKHHVKIGKTYGVRFGDEGEGTDYLTLSGLNQTQKLQFLYERSNSLSSDESEKNRLTALNVYMPYWMSIKDLTRSYADYGKETEVKADPNQIYAAVEVEPSYPNGLEAFKSLFKNVNFNDTYVITFIVRKNGTLTSIKVLRGSNEKIDRQVNRIIEKSPKWIPGKQNGTFVNVQYTVLLIHKSK